MDSILLSSLGLLLLLASPSLDQELHKPGLDPGQAIDKTVIDVDPDSGTSCRQAPTSSYRWRSAFLLSLEIAP